MPRCTSFLPTQFLLVGFAIQFKVPVPAFDIWRLAFDVSGPFSLFQSLCVISLDITCKKMPHRIPYCFATVAVRHYVTNSAPCIRMNSNSFTFDSKRSLFFLLFPNFIAMFYSWVFEWLILKIAHPITSFLETSITSHYIVVWISFDFSE